MLVMDKSVAPPRNGDWIQTYTGRKFWTIDPRPEEIFIEDIAHALAMLCRYNGHCEEFYTVAEHSVLIARKLPLKFKLWGLLHDASEAYIADINRPTKPYLANYKEIEARLMSCVCKRFNLPQQEPPEVKAADNAILWDEHQQNMKQPPEPWRLQGEALGVQLQYWTPKRAKIEFLDEYEMITDAMARAA
jgi:hypothetical protein